MQYLFFKQALGTSTKFFRRRPHHDKYFLQLFRLQLELLVANSHDASDLCQRGLEGGVMPRTKKKITAQNKKPEPGRNANGMGSLRQKTVKGNIYWEGRYSVADPVTGKSVQRSISGKDQAEVYAKMIKAQTEINKGTYIEPSKMTVGEWLDIWLKTYLNGVRPYTILNYTQHVNNHIKPVLGKVKLDKLNTHMIQQFYNDLGTVHGDKPGLSPKTVKCIHGIFHKALQQAIEIGYLRSNPTTACKLPKVERKEVKALDNGAIQSFLKAIRGRRFEVIFLVTLCTGLALLYLMDRSRL